MTRVKTQICLYVILFPICLAAQDVTNFTQFFINPYAYNPSYAGIEGRNAFFLAYRRQWATIDGGPTIANVTFHSPLVGGLNFGLNIMNDTRGVLSNSGMLLTLGYTVNLDDQKFIRFGLSAGGAWNGADLEEIADLNDPALSNLLDNNFSLLGNAGISFHMKSFHIGASLPNIFSPSYVSTEDFTITEVKPFQSLIIHASNRFYFANDKHIFEPYIIYRMQNGPRNGETLPAQFEVAGLLHLNHAVWLGASYKQDFGISAMGGIKNKFFLVGLSYSLQNTGVNELNSPTYEVQMSYIFGPKKKNKPQYSFVDTEKEKIKKPPTKTASQLAAEKRKQEEELAKQKAEEEKAEQEALAQAELEAQQQAERDAQQLAEQEAQQLAALAAQQQAQQQPQPQVQQQTQQPVQQQPQPQQQPQQPAQQQVKQPVQQTITPEVKNVPVVTPTLLTVPYVKSKFGVHDGGPRFTNRSLLPVVLDDNTEQVKLTQVQQQTGNPLEFHNTDSNTNPNAQRHEFVKRGSHPQELTTGNYVINGAFASKDNADRFSKALVKLGFSSDYGHLSKKNLWYVYVAQSNDINEAKQNREKFRNLRLFKDAWLLTVEN